MHTFAEKPKATQQTTSAKTTNPGRAHFGQSAEVSSILRLQRTVGNQAVLRLLQGNSSPGPVHDFSRIPVHYSLLRNIQPKLEVNAPGDIYEQEADLVADQVIRMPEPQLQHTCACGGGCPKCKGEQGSRERLHTKSVSVDTAGHGVSSAEPVAREASASGVSVEGGQPLPDSVRSYFEPRFGHDFSRVRVHTDARAAESAQAMSALAYTVGRSVVFGAGQYAPNTSQGRVLIAHELTHVMQQHCSQSAALQKAPEDPETEGAAEEEAKATATRMTADEKADPVADKSKKTPASCTRTILSEGTCAFLVANSRFICCDPNNGIERKGKKTDIDGNSCPSEKFTPIFTCDSKCNKALAKGCDDNDNWMAVPHNQFTRQQCGDIWTICANGKRTTGYVRDHSVTQTRFEVSPKIQKDLGVTVGSSFKGAIYKPGAKQAAIDKDACCNS